MKAYGLPSESGVQRHRRLGRLLRPHADVRRVGRSFAQFVLPNVNAAWVLQTAHAFGASQGMRLATVTPNQAVFTKGSVLWTGERWLSVGAWDVPGGTSVLVEAWVEGMGQLNADPTSFLGMVPRRDMWTIASTFVAGLGVNPNAVFRHL